MLNISVTCRTLHYYRLQQQLENTGAMTIFEPHAETYKSITTKEYPSNGGIHPKIHHGCSINPKAERYGIGTHVQKTSL
jgi:hypothetical protein